jgi:DNA-binding CsgD family transcriptional regulator
MSTNDGPKTFRNKIKSLTESRLSRAERQRQVGKAAREEATRLKNEGKSNAEIAGLMDIAESTVRKLVPEPETIWFPGIYGGRRDSEYTKPIAEVSEKELILLVQKRAQEDGEWAIDNGHVGDNEDVMRKMMAWVSDEKNILQCYESAMKEQRHAEKIGNPDYEPRTVDYICRDLANGSKWVGGSRD